MQKHKLQVTRNERHAKKRPDIRFQTKPYQYAIILTIFKNVTFDLRSVVILIFMRLAIGEFALKQFVFAQKVVFLPTKFVSIIRLIAQKFFPSHISVTGCGPCHHSVAFQINK